MANTAALKQQFDPLLGGLHDWQSRPAPELLPTGIAELAVPRGALTEILGTASSGRTTLLHALLAQVTARQEFCAVIDAEDSFDPVSAAAAGVHLPALLWVRCGHSAEQALKAADLLIQGGGFGLVALDLGDTAPEMARRISLTSWFRLRRAVEHTPTVLIALAQRSNAKTCAAMQIECRRERTAWAGAISSARLLRGISVRATSAERSKTCSPVFTAKAI
jgi:recombination protein RecA